MRNIPDWREELAAMQEQDRQRVAEERYTAFMKEQKKIKNRPRVPKSQRKSTIKARRKQSRA